MIRINSFFTRRVLPVVVLGLCLLARPALALPDDNTQPIYVKAEKARYDNNSGQMVYDGRVEFRQGTIELYADQVIVILVNGEARQLLATGQPASFAQQLEAGKPKMTATGRHIEYHLNEEQLILDGNARLVNGENTMSAAHIVYNVAEQAGEVVGAPDDDGDGRLEMIIIPSDINQQ